MVSVSDFNNRELQKMDIHELRVMARQIGVSSPTSKKKADLIDNIMSIITGKTVPELKNLNRGRPAKKSSSVIDYSFSYNSVLSGLDFNAGWALSAPNSDYAINKKNTVVSGVVTKSKEGYFLKKFKFADTLDDVFLTEELVRIYNLKENDVVCYTKSSEGVDIYSINDSPASPSGMYTVGDKTIALGKRNIVFSNSISDKRNFLYELQKIGKVVYLPSNNVSVLSTENIRTLPLANHSDEEVINSFFANADLCLYFKKTGGNIMLVADTLLSVISAIKQHEYEKSVELEQELFSRINKLSENGITFVGIIPSTLQKVFTSLSTTFDNLS